MAMTTKQKALWIIGGFFVLSIGSWAIWFFFFRDECDHNKDGYTKKGKPNSKCIKPKEEVKGNGNNNSPSGTSTNCCGIINNCNGLSKSEIGSLQKELNGKGCTDYEDKVLKEDGLCGNRTNSAILKCKNK